MDEILDIKSRGRAPRLTKLRTYEMPMNCQETIRVYTHPGARTISLQMRFTDSYGYTSLTFAEARSLSALLDRAVTVATDYPRDNRTRKSMNLRVPIKTPDSELTR